MTGPEHLIEFFHGYTYSAIRWPAPPALATLDTYADDGLLTRARRARSRTSRRRCTRCAGVPNVIDIRNIGLVGGIELAADRRRAGQARVRRLPRLLGARAC